MTIVLQKDAKAAIIADFGNWAQTHVERRPATAAEFRLFYGMLQSDKRHLLEFRHPCPDKSQVVQDWLCGAGLISA